MVSSVCPAQRTALAEREAHVTRTFSVALCSSRMCTCDEAHRDSKRLQGLSLQHHDSAAAVANHVVTLMTDNRHRAYRKGG